MTKYTKLTKILKEAQKTIELPDSIKEKVENRYQKISEWLCREGSEVAQYDPHIFPQGSFSLGTAVKPINEHDAYDLDFVCKLNNGLTRQNISQTQLYNLIGRELKAYAKQNGFSKMPEQKHRCWCIEYQDGISFHVDVIPAIPADEDTKRIYKDSYMATLSLEESTAAYVAEDAIYIVDDRKPDFWEISDNWHFSNPGGYTKWFIGQTKKHSVNKLFLAAEQIDNIPEFNRKSILQQIVMLLKRHRDIMYSSKRISESKPISIIISTLAARAYNGEMELGKAILDTLREMQYLMPEGNMIVTNPVHPEENFADKWNMPEYAHLELHRYFHEWLRTAITDFENLANSNSLTSIKDSVKKSFNANLSNESLREIFPDTEISTAGAILGLNAREITHINKNNVARPHGF